MTGHEDDQLLRSVVPAQGECPGPCNRAHRLDPGRVPEPVWGEPVWCARCATAIFSAIGALPELAAGLWDIGHWSVDPVQEVVDRQVVAGRDRVVLRERLACQHRWPSVVRRRAVDLPEPAATRWCWQCAVDDPGADGRLAPAPESARRGPRLKGSPAGSAAYLAVDELVMWAARQADYLRARLPRSSVTPDPRGVDDQRRARVLSECVTYLVENGHHLLATPAARAIGQEALDLERRARRSAGMDHAPDEAVPRVPCPSCDLVSLVRSGRDQLVRCRSCGAVVDEQALGEAGSQA